MVGPNGAVVAIQAVRGASRVSCVLLDPQTAGGLKAASPVYMNATACPTPEVVAFLRSESLINLDEPVPAACCARPGGCTPPPAPARDLAAANHPGC